MDSVAAPEWNSLSATPPAPAPQAPEAVSSPAPNVTEPTPDWHSLSATPPEGASAEPTPNWDDLQPAEKTFGTLGQEALAGVEGAAKGFLSAPIATGIEQGLSKLGVPGLSNEEIKGREEANPWIQGVAEMGGLAAGALTGVGELGLIGKGVKALGAADKLAKMGTLGKLGAAAIKGAIEASAIHVGDNISGAMLGKEGYDPEEPVASVLAGAGWSALGGGLLGGAFEGAGSALKAVSNAKAGTNAKQFLSDVAKELSDHNVTGNMADSITGELGDLHEAVKAAKSGVWGDEGLYAQAVKKLVPQETNEIIASHNQTIYNQLEEKLSEMVKDPDLFSKGDTAQFRNSLNSWAGKITDVAATPSDQFLATNQLKREIQELADYGKALGVRPADKAFIQTMRELGPTLRESLENTKVWGDAAQLQKDLNSATSKFIGDKGPLKFFENRFTTAQAGGDRFVRENIGEQLVNQMEKASGEVKRDTLRNFIQPAKDYLEQIDNVYTKNGAVSPIARPTTNSLDKLLELDPSPGAKFGRYLANKGLPGLAEKAALKIGGIAVGEHFMPGVGGAFAGYIGEEAVRPLIERIVGRPISGTLQKYVVPATLNALKNGGDLTGLWKLMDYAGAVAKGEHKSNAAIEALFEGGRGKAVDEMAPDMAKKQREKLKEFIESGQLNGEIEKSLHQSQKPAIQHFAEGGVVESTESYLPSKKAPPGIVKDNSPVATHLPEQNTLLQTAKGRVNTYLNAIRPNQNPSKLPFDHTHKDHDREKAYHRAIDIANDPLHILNHVKHGSLTPDDMKHFVGMYPELYRNLSKKITSKIAEIQAKEGAEPPKYATRQGLSLFLGAPLDSTFTPQNIQAAQAVFAQKKASQQAQGGQSVKKGTSTLTKVADASYTGSQARELRQHARTRG